jgi:hypothetical protein
MDPLNPIVPHSDLTARIPPSPGVPRVSPDEQRQEARDDEHSEHESDEENLEGLLEEATTEDFSTDQFFIPEVDRSQPKQATERPAQERRTADDDEDEDEGPASTHIDIIA